VWPTQLASTLWQPWLHPLPYPPPHTHTTHAAHLQGSKDFPRVRIGIGRPAGGQSVPSYVLQPFSKAEREEIDVAVQVGRVWGGR
jgi:hypothetical protein